MKATPPCTGTCCPLHQVRQADMSFTGTSFPRENWKNPEGMGTITVLRDSNISYKEIFCCKPRELHKQSQFPCAHSPESVKLFNFSAGLKRKAPV